MTCGRPVEDSRVRRWAFLVDGDRQLLKVPVLDVEFHDLIVTSGLATRAIESG
jgi:hypothetical protein